MIQDILIDEDYELTFSDGDFATGESDQQHLALIIKTPPGAWKQFPTQGVGIDMYTGSTGRNKEIQREISVKSESDGYINVLSTIQESIGGGYIIIDLSAKRP